MNEPATHTPIAIETALAATAAQLAAVSDCPALEAQVLLGQVLGKDRSYLLAWPERALGTAPLAALQALVRRRCSGEPLAYITGRREFWSLDLAITPHALIPRPETELLVELALRRLPADASGCVADLGTGSGAIALALARERPRARVIATDVSSHALALARRNADRLGLTNVAFRRGQWFAPLAGEHLDVVCCNPPYLRDDDPHLQAGDLPREPRNALAAGPTGLEAIEAVIDQAPAHMAPGGWLILEHGYDQAPAVTRRLITKGFQQVTTHRDLAGHARAAAARVPAP